MWFGNWFGNWFAGRLDPNGTDFYFESIITGGINANSTLSNIADESLLVFDLQIKSYLIIDVLYDSNIMMLNSDSLITNSILDNSGISTNSLLESTLIDELNKPSSIVTELVNESGITDIVKQSTIYGNI